ncbi:MAG TPA: hypothetical protein QGH35_03815 [Gammaproteobacteria bacterium]|jgi:hypothetical protein|nr:hypothetical protein [Gammaproteobacteria bacterium]|tara:strand:+ start:535 stop:729 length:195 start_codon:yes stop_codon:yes gene_type:complete
MKRIKNIAVSGSFENEGHSVIFIENCANCADKIYVKELSTKTISRAQAINEQDKLIKLGYIKTN